MEFSKNDPKVRDLVNLCYPNWRGRRKIKVSAKENYYLRDYWDGGSRNFACFVHLPTNRLVGLNDLQYEHQTNANPFNLPIGNVTVTKEIAVVEQVVFCGKDLGIRIYVHPDTSEKFT